MNWYEGWFLFLASQSLALIGFKAYQLYFSKLKWEFVLIETYFKWLHAKVDYLLWIGNISTISGLVFTVYGMVQSLGAVYEPDAAKKAVMLAEAIDHVERLG